MVEGTFNSWSMETGRGEDVPDDDVSTEEAEAKNLAWEIESLSQPRLHSVCPTGVRRGAASESNSKGNHATMTKLELPR